MTTPETVVERMVIHGIFAAVKGNPLPRRDKLV